MKSIQANAGFTLVELITVILILGILAATALPKFMNVTEKAHEAAIEGATGGMGAAVALAHAQWIANGLTGAQSNVSGFGDGTVDVNSSGWPIGTAASDCSEVWTGIMQNPPKLGSGNDYVVTGSIAAGCTFTYQPDGGSNTITYNSNNGNVANNL